MEVKNKITLDLQNIDATPLLFAKQGDAGSRSVEITLTDNRALWPVPSSAAILIRYRKASGAAGMYDTLPDGKRAYTVDAANGRITIVLAPQMLAEPGSVRVDAAIISGTQVLATFDFSIQVERSPVDNADLESQDYYKVASLEQINAALDNLRLSVGECVRTVNGIAPDENGNVEIPVGEGVALDATLTQAGQAADAKAVGDRLDLILDDIQEHDHAIRSLSENKLDSSGGVMTGNLNMNGKDIVGAADISAKQFTVVHPTDSDAGAWIAAEDPVTDSDGTPGKQVLTFYANFGDESAILRNVAEPEQPLDAANKGYVDTAIEAVEKLPGEKGEPGASAYELAVASGFEGTLDQWLASLQGAPGEKGADGAPGQKGEPGGYYTPSVSPEGELSWKRSDPTLPAVPSANIKGADGRGIVAVERTSGTGAAGTVDTYTIAYTDNSNSTFNLYNGADGGPTRIPSGYCATEGDAAAKAEQGFVQDEIQDGSMVSVFFVHPNTAANPTLEVNGKTGSILGTDGNPAVYPGIEAGSHLFIWYSRYNGWLLVDPRYNGLPLVETSEASVTLEPGKYYNLTNSGASLALAFAPAQPGRMEQYCGTFYSGDSPKNLTVPAGIQWVGGTPEIAANTTYQFSVMDRIGVIASV